MVFADNESYWVKRHQELEGSLASVGKIGTPELENRQRYARKKRRVVDLFRELDQIDLLGKTVLDAGCGVGMISEIFFALGATVSGLDASPIAIREARDRACPPPFKGDQNFKTGSLVNFDFGSQFDYVFCLDVLYHIVDDDNWLQSLRALGNHVRDNGHLVIIDHIQAEPSRPDSHVRMRTMLMYEQAFDLGWDRVNTQRSEFLVFRKRSSQNDTFPS